MQYRIERFKAGVKAQPTCLQLNDNQETIRTLHSEKNAITKSKLTKSNKAQTKTTHTPSPLLTPAQLLLFPKKFSVSPRPGRRLNLPLQQLTGLES